MSVNPLVTWDSHSFLRIPPRTSPSEMWVIWHEARGVFWCQFTFSISKAQFLSGNFKLKNFNKALKWIDLRSSGLCALGFRAHCACSATAAAPSCFSSHRSEFCPHSAVSFPLNVPVFFLADNYIPNFHICTFSSDPILGARERQKWFAFHCVSHCSTFGIWELSSKWMN